MASSSASSLGDNDTAAKLWELVNPDISALASIIENHFQSPCLEFSPIGGGVIRKGFRVHVEGSAPGYRQGRIAYSREFQDPI